MDVGEARIGIAISIPGVSIARPYDTYSNDDLFQNKLTSVLEKEKVDHIVVGLPRNMDGQETKQTKYVRDFTDKLMLIISLPFTFQDEALTSVNAEKKLKLQAKPYEIADIDSMAASIILQDYLENQKVTNANGEKTND